MNPAVCILSVRLSRFVTESPELQGMTIWISDICNSYRLDWIQFFEWPRCLKRSKMKPPYYALRACGIGTSWQQRWFMSSHVSSRYCQEELLIAAYPTINSHIPVCASRLRIIVWWHCRHSNFFESIVWLSFYRFIDAVVRKFQKHEVCHEDEMCFISTLRLVTEIYVITKWTLLWSKGLNFI